jgi:hypothetical protein
VHRSTLSSPTTAPALVSPFYNGAASAAAWPAANRAVFMRLTVPTTATIRYLNWIVGTASGNVQVGVVALSGTNRTSYTSVVTSGVIACPAAGDIRTDLGAVTLPAGDYAGFIWSDNATFQTRYGTASGLKAMRFAGIASSLASGVPASGTLQWDTALVNLSLEGDV